CRCRSGGLLREAERGRKHQRGAENANQRFHASVPHAPGAAADGGAGLVTITVRLFARSYVAATRCTSSRVTAAKPVTRELIRPGSLNLTVKRPSCVARDCALRMLC